MSNIDKKSKIITKYRSGEAGEHDSWELKNPVEEGKDNRIYADGAYTEEELQSRMRAVGVKQPNVLVNGLFRRRLTLKFKA